MRDAIIDIARKNEIDASVVNLSLEDCYAMDECFIINSLIGMKAINNIADHEYSSHSITNLLFSELLKTKEEYAQIV